MAVNNCIKWCVIFSVLLSVCSNAHFVQKSVRERRQTIITNDIFDTVDAEIMNQKLSKRPSLNEYLVERQKFVDEEFQLSFECDVELSDREQLANKIIKAAKAKEVQEGFQNPYRFNPSRHLFEVLKDIRKSELFRIIQRMPKGGILHAHDTALVSTDFIVSLTYRQNLWQCSDDSSRIYKFQFARTSPEPVQECKWSRVADVRSKLGDEKYDRYVRSLFTLYREDQNPRTQFKDINDAWNSFMDIFILLGPIVQFAPVWKDYYKRALREMYADGVQYLEFRGLLPQVKHPVSYALFFSSRFIIT